jgi:hypothetical protein
VSPNVSTLRAETVRRSMINCSRGDASRMSIPAEVLATDLAEREFVAWHDPKAPQRAWLVAEHEGALAGVLMRVAAAPPKRRTALCALCRTTRTSGDVSLFTAPRAGASGRAGNSVGTYLCDDLDCPATVRLTSVTATVRPEVGRPVEDRVEGLRQRLDAFLVAVRRG